MTDETRDLSIGQALDLGCEFAMNGNPQSAEGLFRGVLMHEPNNFEAMQRLGGALFDQKKIHEALYWFWRGRKLNRRSDQARSNYGMVLGELGHLNESIAELRVAVHLEPNNPVTFNNLGNTLERAKKYPEALEALDRSIALQPNDAFPHYNRGIVLLRLNRHQEAIVSLDRSLELDPISADARYNRGMAHLVLGRLREGFVDYEYRLLTSENKVPNLGLPAARKWNGAEPLEGKTILVHAEQGIGDTIQFMRFLPLLRERGPTEILLVAHKAIRPIARDIANVTVLEPGEEMDSKYHYWAALMSLPMCLDVDDDIPPPMHIPLDLGRDESVRAQLQLRPGLNVGVVWAGNFLHKNDSHRSIPLKQFARLFDTAGCTFHSLQQIRPGEIDEFAKIKAKRANVCAYWFDDLRDTAAAILNLDVVVTVDTAVAHLAASLGVPTWILIPAFSTDWRWQLKRTDSPWYPSATLFRQPRIGDWDSVIDDIRTKLAVMSAEKIAA